MLLTVSGNAWDDVNGNGAWDAGETGLADWEIYLDTNNNGTYEAGEPLQTTAADGSYEFGGLPAGPHVVRAAGRRGYAQTFPGPEAGAYYGAGYRNSGSQTQLLHVDALSGQVTWIGNTTSPRMQGITVTNAGEFYGINGYDQNLYRIDPDTGQATRVGLTGFRIVPWITYDSATDTIYAAGRQEDDVLHLLTVDRTTGAATRVNPTSGGTDAIESASAGVFDAENGRILAFDNLDDEIYAYDLNGQATLLSSLDESLNTWAMAHNGNGPVVNVLNVSDGAAIDLIYIDIGARLRILNLSEPAPMEGMEFLPSPFGHAVHATSSADVTEVNFGQQLLPWHHLADPLDVDDDDRIAPRDALVVINYLTANRGDSSPPPPPATPPPYYDVSGDGLITPLDALLVINFLSRAGSGGSGEGERDGTAGPMARDVGAGHLHVDSAFVGSARVPDLQTAERRGSAAGPVQDPAQAASGPAADAVLRGGALAKLTWRGSEAENFVIEAWHRRRGETRVDDRAAAIDWLLSDLGADVFDDAELRSAGS